MSWDRKLAGLVLVTCSALLGAHLTGTLPDVLEHTPWGQPEPGGYSYVATRPSGQPVTWRTCTIDFVVNPAGAPAGAVEDLTAALERVAAASGMQLRLVGTTDTVPTSGYGQQATDGSFPPVLVAWTTPQSGLLSPTNGGRSFDVSVGSGEDTYWVSSMVVFNADLDDARDGGFDDARSRGAVYLHELAHVIGLGHVDSTAELMNPATGYRPDFGAGDLEGLSVMGAANCAQQG